MKMINGSMAQLLDGSIVGMAGPPWLHGQLAAWLGLMVRLLE